MGAQSKPHPCFPKKPSQRLNKHNLGRKWQKNPEHLDPKMCGRAAAPRRSLPCGIRAISSRVCFHCSSLCFLSLLCSSPVPAPTAKTTWKVTGKGKNSTCAIQNVGNWENVIWVWILILKETTWKEDFAGGEGEEVPFWTERRKKGGV